MDVLTVVFGRAHGAPRVVEASGEILFAEGSIRAEGRTVAVHEHHLWSTEWGRFTRLDIEHAVSVTFRSAAGGSRTFGPYRHFSCVDGIAYAEQRVFAFYDEQQKDWYAFEDGRHWPTFVLTLARP